MLKRKYEERSVERDEDTGTVETTSSTTGAKRKLPRLPLLGGVLFLALAMWAASSTFGGALAAVYVFAFLNFFAGVVTLVALSLTVMCGLVATDRFFLKIGHRVFFQGLHRATAIISIVFLGLHIAMKVLSGTATVIDPFVPFANSLEPIYIGLGTIASYLMFTVFWTGLIRARFAGSGKPWMWRTLHASSYVAWPAALGHGLNAGRPAATWVTLSYGACVIGVLIALLVRVYVSLGRRTSGKTGPSAVGVNVETAIIPRVDGGFREGLATSTREQRAIRDDDLENTAARMMTTARPPRERDAERQDTRVGYAMPVAPPEPRRPREEERVPDELVSPGERRASRSDRSDARRSRLEQMDERAEERRVLERPPAPQGQRADVGERLDDMRRQERRASRSGSRNEDKRSATQWRRGKSKAEAKDADVTDREWYESLRGDEPVSGYGPVSGGYAPSSPAPAPQPERERYARREQDGGGRRRADPRDDRWTSPADERYAGIDPVSAPVSRYDQAREPVSGPAPRYDQSREPISGPAPRYDQAREPVSGPAPRYDQSRVDPVSAPASRYDQGRYDEPRYEEQPPRRAALRLVTDEDAPRRSRRSRSSRGQDEPRPSRREDGRHSLGEEDDGPIQYASEPGYERPGPYPPAVDPMPSRRSRRGRRAAGGEDMDNGAYWTRPREGHGR